MFEAAHSVLRKDPVMAELVDRHDPYVEPDWGEYERLCISIINQQLSTASATAVRERVFDVLDGDVTPERVLSADDAALRDAGLSRRKVEYVQNAARAFQEHDYSRAGLADSSNEEVVDRLTEITGIGEWTARMYLLFVLERPDVLPLGDLAIRRGIEELYADGEELTRAEMREIAKQWRPYRSVATRYVWAEYESDSKSDDC
ncbi:DNA-3-methyladenine glycosylase family protein [Natronobacterium gregoryi]|uniref:DNA-3-methyladenine glycosylase 2 family protein n=2 Tax=Natronobacterium gregoryi TaxID=44930 RepID=L0ACW0_NATGS|nr:DNA-3-methyladenine glycosylase [Natronobacterium gregoryi]AFZ71733.1 HhH-GPD superfamily base excision DNA repair protein [Natronobacterium gregoryi SP2]ELY72880.1 HhH-GPD family protein [Natronobacterium gregoryi SP2]PLK18338.1 DNA-3-methyladenine glycosylase 2 family protein [Natronobacterium gregoryi SP2]SFI89023.1 DNA-3-methyladenine glycosylase II [Natronobacterium gregoryi]